MHILIPLTLLLASSLGQHVSSGASEAVQPSEAFEPSNETVVLEPSESTEALEPSVVDRALEPSEASTAIEPIKASGALEPSKVTEVLAPNDATRALEPSEASGALEPSGACPAACDCGESDGEREYICRVPGAEFTVKGLPNDYVNIICHNGDLHPSAMPLIPLSLNGTLNSASMRGCLLPSMFASVLARLGARGVRSLALTSPRGDVAGDFFEGLEMVETLMIIDAADQRRVPWDLLQKLPALKDFRLREANLTLDGEDTQEVPVHPSLRFLELSLSSIARLPRGAFRRVRNITQLHLFGNNINNISSDAFDGLEHVEVLDLSRNPFEELAPRALATLPRLRRLTLMATSLREVHTGAFAGLMHLETVVIRFGEHELRLGARALAALQALRSLTVDTVPLAPLPADLLHDSAALEELTITGTGLEALPDGLFRSQQRLKRLDLSGNKLLALTSSVFWPLKALDELNLDDNKLEKLPEQLFSGLARVRRVSADRNALGEVARDAFQGATGLEYLSLADNQLTLENHGPASYFDEEQQSPFQTLWQLRELHLQGNRIARVCSDWRLRLVGALRLLDLARNRLTELSRADVQFLGTNMTIDLRHNRIATVDLLMLPAVPGEPERGDDGNVMLLDDNPFKCDCYLFFLIRRLEGVKPVAAEPRLDVGDATCASPPRLAGRRLSTLPAAALTCPLPDNCPHNCSCRIHPADLSLQLDCDQQPPRDHYPNPEAYELAETQLRLRTALTLPVPPHVAILNLTSICLTQPPALKLLSAVREVDLTGNDLTNAPIDLLNANLKLHLSGNPFACDCSHYGDVIEMKKAIYNIVDGNNVTCSDGVYLKHVDVARLCDVRRAAVLGGTLAALGLIAVVLALLAYRYSLEIKVFLFSRGWCRSLIVEDEIDRGSQYDAFVSFSQEDSKWVADKLIPYLEGENNFRLCVHYRDWVVGDMIPAQIARSVEQSNRTIVVLSKSFLKSTWAQLEFRAAHVRAQRERRARVLVIVLDEALDEAEMDAELRAYLTTNTYLKWGDPWFWEKLRYAMPHRRSLLSHVKVADKLKRGALDARLTADGKIVNGGTLTAL